MLLTSSKWTRIKEQNPNRLNVAVGFYADFKIYFPSFIADSWVQRQNWLWFCLQFNLDIKKIVSNWFFLYNLYDRANISRLWEKYKHNKWNSTFMWRSSDLCWSKCWLFCVLSHVSRISLMLVLKSAHFDLLLLTLCSKCVIYFFRVQIYNLWQKCNRDILFRNILYKAIYLL